MDKKRIAEIDRFAEKHFFPEINDNRQMSFQIQVVKMMTDFRVFRRNFVKFREGVSKSSRVSMSFIKQNLQG